MAHFSERARRGLAHRPRHFVNVAGLLKNAQGGLDPMRWIAVLLLAAMLAGCANDDSKSIDEIPTGDPEGPTVPGDPDAPGEPGTENPPVSHPDDPETPEAIYLALLADVTSGQAPLDVNLTVQTTHDLGWVLYDNDEQIGEGQGQQNRSVVLDSGSHDLRVVMDVEPPVEASLTIEVTPPPVPASAYTFDGKLDAGADQSARFEVDVPARSEGITAILTWIEDLEDEVDMSVEPGLWNLDITFTSPSGETTSLSGESYEAGTLDAPEPGTWSIDVESARAGPPVEFVLDVVVWGDTLKQEVFTGELQGLNVGWVHSALAVSAPAVHEAAAPAGTTAMVAILDWHVAGEDCDNGSRTADLDLVGSKDGEALISSGHFLTCEADFYAGDAAGAWEFQVVPFLAPPTAYTLTILYG